MRHRGPVTQESLRALNEAGGIKFGLKEFRALVINILDGMGVKARGGVCADDE